MVIKMRPKPIKKKQQKSCFSGISPYSVAVGVTVSSLVLLAVSLAIATLFAMVLFCSLSAEVQFLKSGLTNCTWDHRKTHDLLSSELSFSKTCFNSFKAERAKNIEYEEELLSKDSEISNLKKEMEKMQNVTDRLKIELKIQRLQSTEDRQAYQRKLDQLTELNIKCSDDLRTCQENPPRDWTTAAAACGVCATIGSFVPGGSAAMNLAMKFMKFT